MIFVKVVFTSLSWVEIVTRVFDGKKSLGLLIILFVYNIKKSEMSISSLPDIFKKATIEPTMFKKQGPSFALRLASQSAEKIPHSSPIYLPGN